MEEQSHRNKKPKVTDKVKDAADESTSGKGGKSTKAKSRNGNIG